MEKLEIYQARVFILPLREDTLRQEPYPSPLSPIKQRKALRNDLRGLGGIQETCQGKEKSIGREESHRGNKVNGFQRE